MPYNPAGPEMNVQSNAFFALEIDGFAQLLIEKYTLTDSEHNVMESRSGSDGPTKQSSAGLKNIQTITIEKSVREGDLDSLKQLVDWHGLASKDKRGGSIVVLNRDKERLYSYDWNSGWVSKWTAPEGDALSNDGRLTHVFEITVPEVTMTV